MRKGGMLMDRSLDRSGARLRRPPASARLANSRPLFVDAGHQIIPGFDEGRRALVLEPGGQRVDVDTSLGEAGKYLLAVAAIRREHLTDLAMLVEGMQGAVRDGVDREGRGERFH